LRDSEVFHRVRAAARVGKASDLCWFEWSVERGDLDDDQWLAARRDSASWAQANPGFPVRPAERLVRNELDTLAPEEFDTERLGLPQLPASGAGVIDLAAWSALADGVSDPARLAGLSLDVGPHGARATFGVGGVRADGLAHVEVADHRQGTAWVVDRALELQSRHRVPLFVNPKSPTAGLLQDLRDAGVELVEVAGVEWERACAAFDKAVRDGSLRHRGEADPWDGETAAALLGAGVVEAGDLWRWSHKQSGVGITPVTALTLAHHAATLPVVQRVDVRRAAF
jgi:hypothetical protein